MIHQRRPAHFSSLLPDGLKLISYCPLCESRYNPMEARLLEQEEDSHLLHVQCKKCRSSILVLLMASQSGVSSVGMVTDLTPEDVLRLREGEPVSVDDVLEIHQALEANTLFV